MIAVGASKARHPQRMSQECCSILPPGGMDIMPFHPPRDLTPESRSHLLQLVEVSPAEDRIYSHHGRGGPRVFRVPWMKSFQPPF